MLALTILLFGALVTVNLLGIKALNTLLIGAGAIALALWLASTTVMRWSALSLLAALEKYVLEIFMVHQYLFIHPTGHSGVDFALSLALILIVSVALGLLADRLASCIFDGRTRARMITTLR